MYLEGRGFEIVERNWSCRVGELDIIAFDGETLVFIEVKSRYKAPGAERYLFETITPRKRHKLRILAEIYSTQNRMRISSWLRARAKRSGQPRIASKPTGSAVRIDVVGVLLGRELNPGNAEIKHLRAAI